MNNNINYSDEYLENLLDIKTNEEKDYYNYLKSNKNYSEVVDLIDSNSSKVNLGNYTPLDNETNNIINHKNDKYIENIDNNPSDLISNNTSKFEEIAKKQDFLIINSKDRDWCISQKKRFNYSIYFSNSDASIEKIKEPIYENSKYIPSDNTGVKIFNNVGFTFNNRYFNPFNNNNGNENFGNIVDYNYFNKDYYGSLNMYCNYNFKNVISIELIEVLLPIINEPKYKKHSSTSNNNIFKNYIKYPYILLCIEEFDTNIKTTQSNISNIFAVLRPDYNKNDPNYNYIRYLPITGGIKNFNPTPLSSLKKMTFKFTDTHGNIISDSYDGIKINKIDITDTLDYQEVEEIYNTGTDEISLNPISIVNVKLIKNSYKYFFNNEKIFNKFRKYELDNGNYKLINIPQEFPIAILNNRVKNYFTYNCEDYASNPIVIELSGGNEYKPYFNFSIDGKVINIENYYFMLGKTYEFRLQNSLTENYIFKLFWLEDDVRREMELTNIIENSKILFKLDNGITNDQFYYQNAFNYYEPETINLNLLVKEIKFPSQYELNGFYNFFYGNVDIKVIGNFGDLSIYSFNNGYMSIPNIFKYIGNDTYLEEMIISASEIYINENLTNDEIIYEIILHNSYSHLNKTYNIDGNDVGYFKLEDNYIKLNTQLDYVNKPIYDLTVSVTCDNESDSKNITININPISEPKIIQSGSNIEIDENYDNNNSIYVIDLINEELTQEYTPEYTLMGPDKDLFFINGNEIFINDSPDYETKNNYNIILNVSVDDIHDSKNIEVNIRNINDNGPIIISGSNVTLDKNIKIGDTVYEILTSDLDTSSDSLNYDISDIYGENSKFFILKNNIIKLQDNIDTGQEYQLKLNICDGLLTNTLNINFNFEQEVTTYNSTKYIRLVLDEYFKNSDFKIGNIINIKNLKLFTTTRNDNIIFFKKFIERGEGHEIIKVSLCNYKNTTIDNPNSNHIYNSIYINCPLELDTNYDLFIPNWFNNIASDSEIKYSVENILRRNFNDKINYIEYYKESDKLKIDNLYMNDKTKLDNIIKKQCIGSIINQDLQNSLSFKITEIEKNRNILINNNSIIK